MTLRALALLAVVNLVMAATPRAAHAGGDEVSSLDTMYFEVGGVQATNVAIFGDGDGMGLSGTGLRYYERHCCLARFLAAVSIGLVLSAGAANPYKSISSETHQEGDYEVTTTTYTYYTEEEKEANRKAAADATASILSFPFSMELLYFPDQDDGKLHGFQWTWYVIEYPRRSRLRLETGFHWDRLAGDVRDPASGAPMEMSYRNVGFPVRVVARPVEWAQVDVEWRWSVFFKSDVPVDQNRNQMVRGSLTVQLPVRFPLVDMAYGRATVQTNNLTDPGKLGYMLELGVRL